MGRALALAERRWPYLAALLAAAVVALASAPELLSPPARRGARLLARLPPPPPLATPRPPPWMSAADVASFERDFSAAEAASLSSAAAAAAAPAAAAGGPAPRSTTAPPRHLQPLSAAPPLSWVVDGRDRRPSAPFVTGDGFRAAADMICEPPDDECAQVDAAAWAAARPGAAAVVFVKQDHVGAFFAKALPRLRAAGVRFVLVTHNSDAPAPGSEEDARRLDEEPLLVAWFAQNPSRAHRRLRAIPLGFENRYNAFGRSPEALLRGRAAAAVHAPRRFALAAFSAETNPAVRGPLPAAAAAAFGAANTTLAAGVAPGQQGWYAAVADHRLVLAPAGHGLDSHRTWETLYLGRVPVVERSALDPLFEGLPVVILDSWQSLSEDGAARRIASELERLEARAAAGELDGAGLRLATHVCRIFAAAGRAREAGDACAG